MALWIHNLPGLVLALFVCGLLTAFAWGGIFAMRAVRRRRGPRDARANDLVATFLSAFGVLYGLVLGLVAVETYSGHDEVDATVAREAAILGTVYRDMAGYPEPLRSELREQVRRYCHFVVNVAFPAQARREIPEGGDVLVNGISGTLQGFQPATPALVTIHAQTLKQFDQFLELRRLRLHYVRSGLPGILWAVVIVGSLLNLAMTWFFVTDHVALHLVLSGILSVIIGLMIVLIAVVDWPFSGALAIQPDAFQIILDTVMRHGG